MTLHFCMNWKSTAVVSGASVLAAWLGVSSEAPLSRPAARMPAAAARDARDQAVVPDIQEQASHLQSRLPARAGYAEPTRNPFKFGEPVAPPRVRAAVAAAAPAAAPLPALPPPPPFTLAGMGGTESTGGMQYTAVLSTPTGVVLAKQGDVVTGWTIVAVDEAGVTASAADGRTERLSLPK